MKFLIVIFFFLLCISIVGPQHQYQTAFSFKLALQWPNSLCNGCRKTPRDFTIHGLWGFDQLGKRLPDCTRGKSLTLSDVNDMRQQLEAAWPDLIRWNDPSFWSYEWSKHGSCLADMWPRKYFSTALVLRDRVGSLVDVLREGKGLVPHRSQRHDPRLFADAIQKKLKVIVELKCNENMHGQTQINEIYFCGDLRGRLINCKYKAIDCGRGLILYA
ncbi:intracellular ribonuclease LX-like isoform X2 [Actinidia eriantha]|uniref:intracellular ribonuclease LX-like isoform X2 n=1 Tax=Actinidia eriantha TaxID=165200 RepID=UPI002582BEA2|nr:intracellular ribonuclease LX-like isoform X2 [Actinidia eriantha]